MLSSKPHLLVADPEYIIAMEAERILHELVDCDVTIVNPHRASERLSLGWTGFALVLLDTGLDLDDTRVIAELLQRQGIAVVFTTANQDHVRGVPGFPTTPVIAKPFGPEQFAKSVLPLLMQGRTRADYGEIGRSVIAEKPGSGP